MFREIFRFELRQQLLRPACWLVFLVFGLLSFWETTSPALHALGAQGDVLRNAPLILGKLFAMLAILSPLAVGMFAATAALRDHDCRTTELLFSTPMSRRGYFGGRFAAALVLALLTMLACVMGAALGGAMPWIEPDRIGPADWTGYLWVFGVISVPAMLFVTGLLFLIASATRSLLKTYVGVVVLVVLVLMSHQLMHNAGGQFLAALLDPYGYHTLDVISRYWTAAQINAQVPAFTGVLLYNRVLWSAIGLGLLAAAVLVPWDRASSRRHWLRRRRVGDVATAPADPGPVVLPSVVLRVGARARVSQFLHWLVFDLKGVLRSTPFLIILLFAMLLVAFGLADTPRLYGAANYPLTFVVLPIIRQGFDWLLSITLIFFAGELVWRDRELRISDTRDALPWPDWIALAAKCCTLVTVVLVFLACGAVWSVAWQLTHGVTHLQPSVYCVGLLTAAVPWVLLGFLCLFVQAVCGNRFVGYVLTVLWLVVSKMAAPLFGWNDHLVWYGTTSGIPPSGMNGFGGYSGATWWFNGYWLAAALVLLLVTGLFWLRGAQAPWRSRWRAAYARASGGVLVGFVVALLAFIGSGAWIFHNIHVLNRYVTAGEVARNDVRYEQAYARYRDTPQPQISAAKLDIAIHPYQHRLDIRGTYTVVNRNQVPVDTLLVYYPAGFSVKAVGFAAHTVVSRDASPHFVVYRLKAPLSSGASMPFAFHLEYAARGFNNTPKGLFLAHNGTFFDNELNSDGTGHDVLPQFGYQPGFQLSLPRERRRFGLPSARPEVAPLGDARALVQNGVSSDAGWMHFDVTLSTSADQTAVTSGVLERSWLADGRRYFHYVTDAPVPNALPIASGRYVVRRARAGNVAIDVYYDPQHAWNVGRIVNAAQHALAYDEANFGPYPFSQLRFVEVPYNFEVGAEAYPGVIVMRETSAGGFLTDLDQPGQIDSIYALLGHEISHQWWPYQELPANVRGLNMVTESFAQYTSLMLMQHRYGVARLHDMFMQDLHQYLDGRRRARAPESPLYDTGGGAQGYIYYDKGALVFQTLEDYLGAPLVNRVLRQFVAATHFKSAPYPTSLQFLGMLQVAAGPAWHPLIDDLFRQITFFDDRMLSATAIPLSGGKYRMTLCVHAAMYDADGRNGRERRARLNIPIEVGVFAKATDGKVQDEKPLYLHLYPVKDGDSTITLTVDGQPYQAGIDPYNELIDKVPGDNRARVTIEQEQAPGKTDRG